MITYKTKEELLNQYPSLQPIWESKILPVLEHSGAIYYAQPLNIFISVFGVAKLQPVFLISRVDVFIGGVCRVVPSSLDDALSDLNKGIIMSLEKVRKHFPHLCRGNKAKVQPIDVLKGTAKHKGKITFMFSSSKGQNLLIVYVGKGLNKVDMFRVYELTAPYESALRVDTPNLHAQEEDQP